MKLLEHQQVPDLFISEYLEGSSNNKAIEIFNPTSSSVDLSNYRVVRSNNGADSIQYIQPLTGSLAVNQVFMLANPQADPTILAVADIDTGAITFFNGDDYMALEKNIAGVWTPIDVIGILGEDPGTSWAVAAYSSTAEKLSLEKMLSYLEQLIEAHLQEQIQLVHSGWYIRRTLLHLLVIILLFRLS